MTFINAETVTTVSGVLHHYRWYQNSVGDKIVAVTSDDARLWLFYRDKPLNHDGFVGSCGKSSREDPDVTADEIFAAIDVNNKIQDFLITDAVREVIEDITELAEHSGDIRATQYVADIIANTRHMLDVLESLLNM